MMAYEKFENVQDNCSKFIYQDTYQETSKDLNKKMCLFYSFNHA